MFNRVPYMKVYNKQWREDNKEYMKIYRKEHKEEISEQRRQYYIEHRNQALEYEKQYCTEHKEEKSKYYKNRRRTNLKYNLNKRIGSRIWVSLKGNKVGRRWELVVGYTLKDLIEHLKKTMPKGYCWNDYFEGKLHIDHIVPIDAFNFTKSEHSDFKKCWALSNLRLLPARENIIKSNKLLRPFQPSLKLEVCNAS